MAESLPLFPLQSVLLPTTTLPLHIFEPRYRQLTVDLISGTVPDKRFGVIAVTRQHDVEITSVDQLRPVGCAALLRQATQLPQGRFDIVTTGERRFRLLDVDTTSAPYLVGVVEWLPDTPVLVPRARRDRGDTVAELGAEARADIEAALARSARAAHRRYCGVAWQRDEWSEPPTDTDPAQLAHLLAVDCVLTLDDRQRLLEETRPLHRLRMITHLLNREAGILGTLRAVPAPPSRFGADTSGTSKN